MAARDEFIATVAHELRNPIAPLTFQVQAGDRTRRNRWPRPATPVSVEWMQVATARHGATPASTAGNARPPPRRVAPVDGADRSATRTDEPRRRGARRHRTLRRRAGRRAVHTDAVRARDSDGRVGSAARRADLPQPPVQCDSIRRGTTDRRRGRCRSRISRRFRFAITASASRRDQQSQIFERFERGVEQRSGGFGIGLWIVQEHLRRHGRHRVGRERPRRGRLFYRHAAARATSGTSVDMPDRRELR